MRARIGKAEAARLERVTQQEESGQRETVGDILPRRIARLAEKGRQRQQLVLPRLALPPRHGTSRFRRHIDEIVGAATHGASREIETEAELPQQQQLEAHDARSRAREVEQAVEHLVQRGMDVRMRVALRQQAAQRGEMRHAVEGMGNAQERGRARVESFDRIVTEMLVEPRSPGGDDAIAGLQHRLQPRPRPSPNQAEMAPVRAREQLKDGIGLSMASNAEHDAFVAPLHRYSFGNSSPISRWRSGSSPQPSRTCTNRNKCTGASTMAASARRASAPIAFMVCPPLPSTILRWLSRST